MQNKKHNKINNMPTFIDSTNDRFSDRLLSEIRQTSGCLTESDQGPLFKITALDALKQCVSRCAQQTSEPREAPLVHALNNYLNYLELVPSIQGNALLLNFAPDGENLSCVPMKHRRNGSNFFLKKDRIYANDSVGDHFISDKKTISFEAYYQLIQQAENVLSVQASPANASCESNAEYAKKQRATGNAIAGHGALEKDYKEFKLPKNIILRTYHIQGQKMLDRVGIDIEAGHYDNVESQTFQRTYNSGNFVRNYIIYPPDECINVLPGSITVRQPVYLSALLEVLSEAATTKGKTMTIDLATCQSYILPDKLSQPKENILARLEIFDRDRAIMENEYGSGMPEEVRDHLRNTVSEIISDAEDVGLYPFKRTIISRNYTRVIAARLNNNTSDSFEVEGSINHEQFLR